MTRQDRHNIRAMKRVLRQEGVKVPKRPKGGCLSSAVVLLFDFVVVVVLLFDFVRQGIAA